MRLLLLFCLVTLSTAFSLFGIGSSRSDPVTHKDSGELRPISNPNLGRGVMVEKGRHNTNEGDEIFIPRNTGIGSGVSSFADDGHREHPVPPVREHTVAPPRSHGPVRSGPEERVQPDNRGREGCPSRIDAMASVDGNSYLFDGNQVYTVRNNRITSSADVADLFPGVPQVKGAVYDPDKELFILFNDRKVYGYRKSGSKFTMAHDYPKDLPDNIAFSPNAAIRWHDGHQMVLSSGGMFALYDEYWNKSLMSGRIGSYFEGLPDRVRGVSDWKNGRGQIYTQNQVYEYDKAKHGTVGEGRSVSSFFDC